MNDYNILECRIEFKGNNLHRITVLVEISKNDVRAIYATNKSVGGYIHFYVDTPITNNLIQQVAGMGYETVDRDEIFPGWRKRYLNGYYVNET